MNLSIESALSGAADHAEKITGVPAPQLGKIPAREMNIVSLTLSPNTPSWDVFEGYPVDEARLSLDVLVPFSDVMAEVNLISLDHEYETGIGYQYEVEYELKTFRGHKVESIGDSLHEEILQALIAEYLGGESAA